jgi:phosphate:Na+ symporter
MGTIIVLDLMGGVALLLWGLHMVESGILRAFGSQLRQFLGKALNNRFAAFAAGLVMTALLQSSTATGLITVSFVAEGLVGLVPGLAIMLGANVGTTLIVFVLSFNIAAVAPIFFLIGLVAFRAGGRTRIKDLGRVAIGLGLMLLALHLLFDALAPAENAPAVRVVLEAIANDPVFYILIAAALTCAAHSSIAIVLLVMSLTYSNFITPFAALAFVLGANLGSALNPVLEAGRRNDPTSYRLPVGNLFNRIVGVVLVVPFLHPIARALSVFEPDAARMTAEFHLLFNAVLALVFLGLLDPFASLLCKLFPERKSAEDPSAPRYLDEGLIEAPSIALGDAARETLRVADFVETMLRDVMTALLTNDRTLTSKVSHTDRAVDRLSEAIKLYVTELTRGGLAERESQRATEIISFAINLEHIGDIIDKNLCQIAVRKSKHNLQFSPEGAAELETYHRRVLENFKTALVVFMSGDLAAAHKLVAEKTDMRNAELAAAERHLERLREGRPETVETTSLHLAVLRDLKRIHSHICSVGYPVLQSIGEVTADQAGDSMS